MSEPASNGHGLPEKFIERLCEIVPEFARDVTLQSFHKTPSPAFRVNTLKSDADKILSQLHADGITAAPLPMLPQGFTVPVGQREQLTHHDVAANGNIYIQTASSQLAGHWLDVEPGMVVMDLAAAPGGKTTHLAELIRNQGTLSAVEPVKSRFFRLKANLEKHGVACARCYRKDGRFVWRNVGERFDRVLLDAPCSSESRFHINQPQSFAYWSEKKIKEMARKQKQLLYSAIQSARPGGQILYSTCSFAPEENEMVVASQLKKFGDAIEVVPLEMDETVPQQPALQRWKTKDVGQYGSLGLRILPDDVWRGFYLCKLRKLASTA